MMQAPALDIITQNAGEVVRRAQARDLAANVVQAIFRLAKLSTLHSIDNQAMVRQVEETVAVVQDYGQRADQNVSIFFAHGTIFVGGQLLKANRSIYEGAMELGEILRHCQASEIHISREARAQDFYAFVTAMSEALRSSKPMKIERPSPRIRLREVDEALLKRELTSDKLDPNEAVVRAYASAVVIMRRFFEDLTKGRYSLPQRVKRIAQRLVDLSEGETPAFLGVTSVRNANQDDAGRAVNTAVLAVAMARQVTPDPVMLSRIAMAALLYDTARPRLLGIAGRPTDPRAPKIVPHLSEQQDAEVPAGTAVVLTALGRVNEPSVMRTVIAYEAHWTKRQNRLGPLYRGLRVPAIQARLLAIARQFNDLLTPAPGVDPMSADQAIAQLEREAADPADRTVLRLLVGALGIFPTGTLVELSTGEVAIVIQTPADPAHYSMPRVRLVFDASGGAIHRPIEVDLAMRPEPGEQRRTIRRIVATSDDPSSAHLRAQIVAQPKRTATPGGVPAYAPAHASSPPPVERKRTQSFGLPESQPGAMPRRRSQEFAPEPPAEYAPPQQERRRTAPLPLGSDPQMQRRRTGDIPLGSDPGRHPATTPVSGVAAPRRSGAIALGPDATGDRESAGGVPRRPSGPVAQGSDPSLQSRRSTGPIALGPDSPGAVPRRPSGSMPTDPAQARRSTGPIALGPDSPSARRPSGAIALGPDAPPGPVPERRRTQAFGPDPVPVARSSSPQRPGEPRVYEIADPDTDQEVDQAQATRAVEWHDQAYLLKPEEPAEPAAARSPTPLGVPPAPTASGDFTRTPFVHLLVYMLDQRLTGTTVFQAPDGVTHGIYFHEGAPAKIRTGSMIEPLDRVLLDLGLLDEATLRQSLSEVSKKHALHGRHLVIRGLLDRDTVLSVLKLQLVRKLMHLFELPAQTRYAYYDGINLLHSYGGPELTPVEPLGVIMAGVRLRADDHLIDATLERISSRPLGLHPEGDIRRLELQRHELPVVDLLRTRRMTLQEILGSGVGQERGVKLTLYALAITRHLDLGVGGKPPVGVRDDVPFVPNSAPVRGAVQVQPGSIAPPPSSPRAEPARTATPTAARPGYTAPPAHTAPPAFTAPPAAAVQASAPPPREQPAAPAAMTPELEARRAEIQQRDAEIDQHDYYQMLGVPEDATHDQIQRAFFAQAKAWHPDRQPAALADLKSNVAHVFARINEAYQTLTDPARRQEYAQARAHGGGTSEDDQKIARVVDAALEFQKAEVFVKKNDLANAERLALSAVQADPDQPDYMTLLVWIQALRRGEPPPVPEGRVSSHYDDLIKTLDSVIAKEPRYEKALFYRGMLLKRSGRGDKAIRDFRLAAEVNPKNLDAMREVRLYEMRRRGGPQSDRNPAQGGSGGLLGKLFKK